MSTMKKIFTLALVLGIVSTSIAQDENHPFCSKRNAFKNITAKSSSFSTAQIAQTEEYDVTFYALDLAMDNLSTDVAGTS